MALIWRRAAMVCALTFFCIGPVSARAQSLADTASDVLRRLPSSAECRAFSTRLAPAIRSNEQRPLLQRFFESLLSEGRSGQTCNHVVAQRSQTLDPERFENQMPDDGGVMEQWWGWANKCALTYCEGGSGDDARAAAARDAGGQSSTSSAAAASASPAIASPSAGKTSPQTAAVPAARASERARCTVTWAASVTNKLPVDPSLLETSEFWLKEVKPYWRTGRLMKFTAEAEREADSDFMAAALARDDANSVARKAFDEMRARIWNLYAPGALDFNVAHRYEKCRNSKTGAVRPGSEDPPDFIPSEAAP